MTTEKCLVLGLAANIYIALLSAACWGFAQGTTKPLSHWPKPTPWQRRRHVAWKLVKGVLASVVTTLVMVFTVLFTLPTLFAFGAGLTSNQYHVRPAPEPSYLHDDQGHTFRVEHYSNQLYTVEPVKPPEEK